MQVISGGHQPNGGAFGIINETVENRNIVGKMINLNNSIADVTINSNVDWRTELSLKIAKVNELCKSGNVDCYSDIHFNAFDGTADGVECIILGYNSGLYGSYESYQENYIKAERVCLAISKALGIDNRGVKFGDFDVLEKVNCHSMIIEVCFLDNSYDMDRYNADKVARAILEGLGESAMSGYQKEHIGRYINVKPFNEVFQVFKDDSSWELWNRQTLLGAEDGLSVKILDNLRKHVYKVSHPYGEGFVYIDDLVNNFTVTDGPAYRTGPPVSVPKPRTFKIVANGYQKADLTKKEYLWDIISKAIDDGQLSIVISENK